MSERATPSRQSRPDDRYAGEVGIYRASRGRVRVAVEAANVRAEVYITAAKARDLRDELDHLLSRLGHA